jgi:hypothetical protein
LEIHDLSDVWLSMWKKKRGIWRQDKYVIMETHFVLLSCSFVKLSASSKILWLLRSSTSWPALRISWTLSGCKWENLLSARAH